MFWEFNRAILANEGYRIEQENSPTGDVCHYNITGLTNKQAKDIFKKNKIENGDFRICNFDNSNDRSLILDDLN